IVAKVVAATKVKISTLVKQPIVERVQAIQRDFPDKETTIRSISSLTTSQDKKISKVLETFVIIGTSTGGPRALQEVLTRLPSNLNAPILIVQHMPPGFTKSLAQRLDGLSDIQVKEAEDGEPLLKGVAYIAPGGKHLKFEKCKTGYCVRLDIMEPPRMGHRPSVDVLLESAAAIQELQYVT